MSRAFEINDDVYPFSAVTYIRSTFPDGSVSTGTGFIVGQNDVLTASHVVYNARRGGDAVTLEVFPSFDPDAFDNLSFFASNWLRYTDFDPNFDGRLVSGDFYSMSHAGAEKDIALLTVNGGIGRYGWFGIDFQHYTGTFEIENAGYPGIYGRNPMYDTGIVTGSSTDNVYLEVSGLDVNPGNSGGPVYYTNSEGPYAIGLISTGGFYTSLSGHEFWLRDALLENDVGGGPANLTGTSGNDVFRLSSGSNSVDGGAGSDTVQYQSARSAATVTYDNGVITVSKASGTDRIVSVERIDFTDGDLIFDVASASAPAAYRLYGGAFDRTPDEGGFRFWAQTLDKGVSLNDAAAHFIASDEFIGRYGNNISNAAFVDALYLNVINRPGEADGLAFWNRMLNNNTLDRADVLVEFTQLPEYVGISAADITNGYWVA